MNELDPALVERAWNAFDAEWRAQGEAALMSDDGLDVRRCLLAALTEAFRPPIIPPPVDEAPR